MKIIVQLSLLLLVLASCRKPEPNAENQSLFQMKKQINAKLPTIGILIFEGFLTNEVTAPLDVFTKPDHEGNPLFNVVTLAKEAKNYVSEEGLTIIPDMLIAEAPELTVLIVPSSFRPDLQVADSVLIDFIRKQNESTDFIASHCAGAFMLGQSGIADQKKVVTYVGGAQDLEEDYPKLIVQNDEEVDYVMDGKIISSNGSLVSYPASFELLEALTSKDHRHNVENELLYHKLK